MTNPNPVSYTLGNFCEDSLWVTREILCSPLLPLRASLWIITNIMNDTDKPFFYPSWKRRKDKRNTIQEKEEATQKTYAYYYEKKHIQP